MQAFRQRGIEGDVPQKYPAGHQLEGQQINYNEVYKAGPGALWAIPTGAKIWESGVTDITPILSAVKDDVKQLAAVTSTALYILSPDLAGGSAEGASLAREALNFNVGELQDRCGDSFASSLSLTFQAQGDTVRAESGAISTIWANIDGASMTDKAAAAAQAVTGGLPQRFIDQYIWGLTPEEQEQAASDRQQAQMLAQALAAQAEANPALNPPPVQTVRAARTVAVEQSL
jgi:hypothetical protein